MCIMLNGGGGGRHFNPQFWRCDARCYPLRCVISVNTDSHGGHIWGWKLCHHWGDKGSCKQALTNAHSPFISVGITL